MKSWLFFSVLLLVVVSTESTEEEKGFSRASSWDVEPVFDWWNDLDIMGDHYRAISAIRWIRNDCQGENEDILDAFEIQPQPNMFYDRTPRGIFLEVGYRERVNTPESTITKLNRLYTPFGRMNIIGWGDAKRIQYLSKCIVERLSLVAELVDITERVRFRFITANPPNLRIEGDKRMRKESWSGAGDSVRLYALKFSDECAFSEGTAFDEEDPEVFSEVELTWNSEYDNEINTTSRYSYQASLSTFHWVSSGSDEFDSHHPSFWRIPTKKNIT